MSSQSGSIFGEGDDRRRYRPVTPELQAKLAEMLEEAAVRVRGSIPVTVEFDVEDDLDWLWVSPTERIPGMRSPLRRNFRIEWS